MEQFDMGFTNSDFLQKMYRESHWGKGSAEKMVAKNFFENGYTINCSY